MAGVPLRRKGKLRDWLGSAIIGMSSGALLGWSIVNIVSKNVSSDLTIFYIISIALFSVGGLILDIFHPVMTELVSYCIVVWIIAQVLWDLNNQPFSMTHAVFLFISFVVLFVNIFAGYLRKGTGKKVLLNQWGVR